MKKAAAKPIAELVPGILSDTLAKRSGMTLDLLAEWADIAGPDHAPHTMPEKIIWPRRADESEPFEPATLVLACEGHHALFVQHAMPEFIERLNRFFGYGAIGRIKLVQKPVLRMAPLPRRAQRPNLTPQEEQRLADVLEEVESDNLHDALERFGRGVIAKQRNSR